MYVSPRVKAIGDGQASNKTHVRPEGSLIQFFQFVLMWIISHL